MGLHVLRASFKNQMRDIDLGRAIELALFAIEAAIKNRLSGVIGQQFFARDGTDRLWRGGTVLRCHHSQRMDTSVKVR